MAFARPTDGERNTHSSTTFCSSNGRHLRPGRPDLRSGAQGPRVPSPWGDRTAGRSLRRRRSGRRTRIPSAARAPSPLQSASRFRPAAAVRRNSVGLRRRPRVPTAHSSCARSSRSRKRPRGSGRPCRGRARRGCARGRPSPARARRTPSARGSSPPTPRAAQTASPLRCGAGARSVRRRGSRHLARPDAVSRHPRTGPCPRGRRTTGQHRGRRRSTRRPPPASPRRPR